VARATLLLLPDAIRLGGDLAPALADALGRADRLPVGGTGTRAQLQRHFDLSGDGWPVAAITRQCDAGDATTGAWLRADPAWVRAEMTGARLFGSGDRLGVSLEDVHALLPALQPLFADAGLALDAPDPARWYVRLPSDARLPAFVDADEALGTDVFDHQPQVVAADADAGRQWRGLLNDVQVTLHNHPRNAQRVASGFPPINSLWFWGAGSYPAHVTTPHAAVHSDDVLLRSLATAAAVDAQPLPQRWQASMAESLVDLRPARDMEALTREWIMPAIKSLSAGASDTVIMDFMDGSQFLLSRGQRWRFWRKPLRSLSVPHVESRAPSS
jgi:hypothetical protein